MATETNENTSNLCPASPVMTGRKEIQTSEEEINESNLLRILEQSYVTHLINRGQIEYLYKYYKGEQPILQREKEVRPEIMNTIVENRANAIVTFRVGYTVGKPIQYVSSSSEDYVSQGVAKVNDMMRVSGKPGKDKQLVEWQMICGTGYRMVLPKTEPNSRVPFEFWTADPRQTFVIYRNDIGHTPLCGVYYTADDNQNLTFHCYTPTDYFRVEGWQSSRIVEHTQHVVGGIPIIEYPLNMARLGCFEIVLPLLDSVNLLESNRMDSVLQFVQSLLIAINCEFPEETTANQIREAGMVAIRSIGENKAELKVISEILDQAQSQTLKQNILDSIYQIVGVPSQGNGYTSDSSNNGAIILKNGWQGAETRAQDFEQMFREPEQRFLDIVFGILASMSDVVLDSYDVDIKFTRRNYEDLLTKSQTLITMLENDKIHPQCAYEACGLFVDTQEAYNMGMAWFEEQKKRSEEMAQMIASQGNNDTSEEEEDEKTPPEEEKEDE